jgi:hypothetical protein
VISHHVSDDGETAADIKIARGVEGGSVHRGIGAGDTPDVDPIGVTERGINPHGINCVCVINHHG